MPVQKRSRVASFALSALASAVIGAAILPPAHAAGLGKLTVLSALGQPLRAEIELTAVTPEEAADLAVKLAPLEAFRAANIEFNPALLNLRFDIEQRDGRRFIRVTSAQPVNEPFVDMLLELSWANGRLVREYTFLLDPADMRNAQSPQVAAPVDVNRAAAQAGAPAASTAPAAPAPARERPAAAARPGQPAPAGTGDVRVKRGDTLSGIAIDVKPADVSLDMMLVALYRANPEAFSGNNMNRLKSGRILSVPDVDTVRATDQADARRVVIAHAADFNAYRNRLAGQVEAATPAQGPAAQQSAGGKITAKVEERPNPVNEAQDQLKLSKAGEASGKAGQTGATEDKIAKDQQVADAAARVKELEKNVSDLEKLMAVKSQAGVEAQQGAGVPELDNSGAPVAAAPQPLAPAVPAAAPAAKPAAKPAALPPAIAPASEPGIMDAIKDNMAALGIALAAILGGTALILARRRKAGAKVVQQKAPVAAPVAEPAGQSLFAEAGGQSVDTSNSVFNSNFAPSASQLDMNEVDPVAEADVYIAYGRDAQAEEILKEALRTHPDRHAVRLKLMEIYANRKDLLALEVQANELYALTKGHGDEWAQAAALGRSVDPGNPLYGAAGGAGPLAATAAAAGAAALAADAIHSPAHSSDFAAALDDAARARAAEPAPHEGLDLDLSQEPAPEAAVNALDFDFADTPAPAPAAEDRLADFDFSDATAQPDAPAAEPPATPVPPKVSDAGDAEHYLDFDLGGLDFEPTPQEADRAAAARSAQAPADPSDLAFDVPAQPAPAPASAPSAAEPDFDFDLPPDDKAATGAAAPGADPLAELDLMDFDVPPPSSAPVAADPAPALDKEPDLGLPDLSEPPAAAPPPPEFDLSGIDLDLDETATPQDGAAGVPAALTPQQMEMDTKLDLAVAYQEIGDKEGARELLDEVLRGGSSEQVARANQMLAQLG
ncbi:FimV/HubP family polar landmark protein [Pseudoduganella umbonata]|uniref:Pilus assembly protein FimV n=1 Tax=Pseudoduganella umbonata TaxID=864828 RepID=A0A4P8HRY5_9BURK|nr:FimV/HubP family polar landmark protein [Pseudoduganella umbonata]MBB3224348.1 pilus assembly protein FimV [Pseudoduganella umbonata]QCP11280.1 pilus assembly protein FimV [Pseudoduganella umbonata]